MTLFRLALRSHRLGAIATAAIGGFVGLLNSLGYVQVAGPSLADRLAFAHQMELLGQQFTYLLPRPIELDTMGGYLTWRNFSSLTLVYAIWALLAATGAARGDEERGLVEGWLASGVSRARLLLARALGFAVAATLSIAGTLAVTELGAALGGEPLPGGGLVLEGIAMLSLIVCAFGLGLVVAQLVTTRRSASVIAGALIIALFLLNSAGRTGIAVGAFRWLSPFYLVERSTPLLARGSLDLAATAALLAATVVLIAIATLAFARRDLGGPLLRLRAERTRYISRPASDPLLRLPILALVDQQRGWIATWAAGLALLGYFLTSIARAIVDSLLNVPGLRFFFERQGIAAYADLVGVIWFGTALLIVSLFVVAQVNTWAADDAEGRLEMILAAAASRPRVVLERIAALLVAVAVIEGVSTLAVYLATRVYDITIPAGRMALAAALVLPVVFALAGIGHALVGWRPRVAVVVLGAVSVVSYFTQEFAALFDWPEWVGRTSLYALYGTPLSGVDWSGIATLVAIGAFGTAVALVAMQRRDVGR